MLLVTSATEMNTASLTPAILTLNSATQMVVNFQLIALATVYLKILPVQIARTMVIARTIVASFTQILSGRLLDTVSVTIDSVQLRGATNIVTARVTTATPFLLVQIRNTMVHVAL